MKLRLMFTLLFCIFSCSMSYGMACKDNLAHLKFNSATIQANAVMCRYSSYNIDGSSVYSADYIDGKYQPAFGNWRLSARDQFACLASQDGNSSDCQFKLIN